MRDPGDFKDRETWLAYLMGFQDGRREYEALINGETPALD